MLCLGWRMQNKKPCVVVLCKETGAGHPIWERQTRDDDLRLIFGNAK
jgi:hypothetical protein